LAILNVYKELKKLGSLETFLVEPKYGKKGCAEPDIFCQYRKTNFFVEVQRTYSEKLMNEKLDRYVELYNGGFVAKDPFPHVLILSDQSYAINCQYPFKIFQAESFTQFEKSLKPAKKIREIKVSGGIKAKIG